MAKSSQKKKKKWRQIDVSHERRRMEERVEKEKLRERIQKEKFKYQKQIHNIQNAFAFKATREEEEETARSKINTSNSSNNSNSHSNNHSNNTNSTRNGSTNPSSSSSSSPPPPPQQRFASPSRLSNPMTQISKENDHWTATDQKKNSKLDNRSRSDSDRTEGGGEEGQEETKGIGEKEGKEKEGKEKEGKEKDGKEKDGKEKDGKEKDGKEIQKEKQKQIVMAMMRHEDCFALDPMGVEDVGGKEKEINLWSCFTRKARKVCKRLEQESKMRQRRDRILQNECSKDFQTLPFADSSQMESDENFLKLNPMETFIGQMSEPENQEKNGIEGREGTASVSEQSRRRRMVNGKTVFDLWGSDLLIERDDRKGKKEIETSVTRKGLKRRRRKSVIPSMAPAVRLPHSGQSYNPSEKDYQECIQWATELDFRQILEDKVVEEQMQPMTTELYKHFTKEAVDRMNEMERQKALHQLSVSSTLFADYDRKEKTEAEDSEKDASLKRTATQREPKSVAQRNREARQRLQRDIATKRKKEKVFLQDVTKIDDILKQLEKKERRKTEQVRKRQALLRQKLEAEKRGELGGRGPRIGKNRFVEKPEDVLLPEEWSQSIRAIKAGGDSSCAMLERSQSVYRRGLIEPMPDFSKHGGQVHKIKSRVRRLKNAWKLKGKANPIRVRKAF